MIISKKVRLKPTKKQEAIMWKSVGTARFIYNWTIKQQQENYNNGGKFISDNDLRKKITQLKKDELSWLNEVSNNVAKQAVKDACIAYKKFFKGLSKYPKFKSKKRSRPSFYNDNVKLKVKTGLVLLEKVGWIRTSEQLPIDCKYYNPRIIYDGKYWYLSIGIDVEQKQHELNGVIGIDLGVKTLAVCSNGFEAKNINKSTKIKGIEKRIKRLQRQISRKYIANRSGNRYLKTANILKLERKIKLLYRTITNIRLNHVHQTTAQIVKAKPSKVVMENLNVRGMMKNRNLAKAIQAQSFHRFITIMTYKCELNGIVFKQVPWNYPSSKLCSSCGTKKADLKLSDRTYRCSNCGLEIDRDLNASLNLAKH